MALRRALLALAIAAPALADERFDHRGAVGLLVGGGLEHVDLVVQGEGGERGFRFDVDLGGTYAIGDDGNELVAIARLTTLGAALDPSLIAGYRGYFGKDRLKTFFDLDAAVHFAPRLVVGPRVGFGVQFEALPVVGVYLGLGAQLGFGQALRFDGELIGGLQFRSYLLE